MGDLWEAELEAKPSNEVSWGETEELVGEFRCQDGHDRACSRLCVNEVRVTKRHLNRRYVVASLQPPTLLSTTLAAI